MAYHDVKTPWEGWHVINKIGKGGFGTVYEIERSQYGIQERAAMKVITIPQFADEIDDLLIEGYDNNSITQRFDAFAEDIVREYGMMAQMKGNANIVYCDDYRIIQQDNGFGRDIYIRMELLTPLLKAMDRVSSESQIIRFGMEMCNALEACQKRKVIHRDIKPQNIFVSDDGVFKLGDFGIARKAEKTTRATVGKGTYQFMAPEVKNELPYGPTVDVYSLGLVMYWLLNDRRCPFFPLPPAVPTHKEEQEALHRRFSGEQIPAPKNGGEELKRIVLKACAFDPKDRYQSAREMREDLLRLSGGYAPELQPEVMSEPKPVPIPEIQDDVDGDRTVGPVFNPASVVDEDDSDKTVGPIFVPKTQSSPKKKVNIGKKVIAFALVLALVCFALVFGSIIRENTAPKSEELVEQAVRENENSSNKGGKITVDTLTNGVSATEVALLPNTLGSNPLQQIGIARESIHKVIFLNTLNTAPSNTTDVSANHDGSVLAWVEGNDVYIAAEGKINAQYCENMFNGCSLLETVSFGEGFNTGKATSMEAMFSYCPNLRSVDVEVFDTSNVTTMKNMFALMEYGGYVKGYAGYMVEYANLQNLDVSGWDTSNVCDMSGMFTGCKSLEQLDVSAWNMSSVTDLGGTFAGCEKLKILDVSNWDLSAVTNMWGTFCNCYSLSVLDVSNWDTSKVTSMDRLFSFCQTLEVLDVAAWDTSSVTNMGCVFEFCENVQMLDVANWDTSNVLDLSSTFRHCTKITSLDVANWDTSNVTYMYLTFCEDVQLNEVDVSNWDVSNVQDMSFMFWYCDSIRDLKVNNWDVSACYNYEFFMRDGGKVNGKPWVELFTK